MDFGGGSQNLRVRTDSATPDRPLGSSEDEDDGVLASLSKRFSRFVADVSPAQVATGENDESTVLSTFRRFSTFHATPAPGGNTTPLQRNGSDQAEGFDTKSPLSSFARRLLPEATARRLSSGRSPSSVQDRDEPTETQPLVRRKVQRAPSYMPPARHPDVNPFINHTRELTGVHTLKMVLVGIFVLPIKLLLAMVGVLVMWVLAVLCTLGVGKEQLKTQPLAPWRQYLFRRPMLMCLRLELLLFGVWRVKVKGKAATKAQAPIIVANHISFLEPLWLAAHTLSAAVQRGEDQHTPFLGTIFKAAQSVFVDRGDRDSRRATVEAIAARAKTPDFPQVLIFPEGTCTNGSALITFKNGAFACGVPVQPVLVSYKLGKVDPSVTACGLPMWQVALRLLCSLSTHLEVEFMDVYVPSQAERQNPSLYASNVQKLMAAQLKVPVTQHAYEDVALAMAARKLALPPAVAMVEWKYLMQTLDINVDKAKEFLRVFQAWDLNHDGMLSYEEFASALVEKGCTKHEHIPNKALIMAELQAVFELFDTEDRGELSFRDFVSGLAVLNGRGAQGRRGALKFMFDVLAPSGKGSLTQADLSAIIRRTFPNMPQDHLEELFDVADTDQDGLVSREEFIDFVEEHEDILGYYKQLFFSDVFPAQSAEYNMRRGSMVLLTPKDAQPPRLYTNSRGDYLKAQLSPV